MKIVNRREPLTIFIKKTHSYMFDRVLNTPLKVDQLKVIDTVIVSLVLILIIVFLASKVSLVVL